MSVEATVKRRAARRASGLGGAGLVVVLGLLAWLYAPILGYDFVMFDDDVNIYANPHIGELTRERFAWAWTGHDYMPRVMPVAWLTLMTIFGVAGMDPAAYHGYNLAMHGANTALVYAVALLALRLASRSRGEEERAGWSATLALIAAAAWGLHPLRSESVAWATGWIYPTTTFYALAATWLALRRLEFSGARRRVLLGAATLGFVVSVLVYPVTLGWPAGLLAFEWWLGRGRAAKAAGATSAAGRLARTHVVFFTVSAVALGFNVWARVAKNEFYPPTPSLETFTLENRVAQAVVTVPYYAVRMAWAGETTPVRDLRAPRSFAEAGVAAAAAGLLGAAGWALWRWRAAPGWVAAGFAFAGAAAPFSGFLDYPFQASDRYGYFPGVVVIVALAVAARRLEGARVRRMVAAGGLAWVGWVAAAVPAQLPKWADSEALFGHLRATLGTAEGRHAYGGTLAVQRAQRGDFEGARELIAELEADGAEAEALGRRREKIAKLEAAGRAATVIPTPGGVVAPDALLAQLLALRDARAGEERGARFRYLQCLRAYPDYHDARYNFALWLAGRGRVAEAWSQYGELAGRAGAALPAETARRLRAVIAQAAAATGDAVIEAEASR